MPAWSGEKYEARQKRECLYEVAKNLKLGERENACTVQAVQPDSGSPLWTCSKESGWDSNGLLRIHNGLYTGTVHHSTGIRWRSLCTAGRQQSEISLHTSFKDIWQKDWPKMPQPKAQGVEITQTYTVCQKASGTVVQESHLVGKTNKTSLNN